MPKQFGNPEPMKRQKLFAGFLKRLSSRFIDLTQPSLQVIQSLFRFRIALESQCITEPAMTFFAIPLRKMPLKVPILVDRAALVELTFPSLVDGLLR